ncbi:MAG: hypothetical protein ACTSYN_03435 [Candidatus Heimdallarchaeaceae archaeon]
MIPDKTLIQEIKRIQFDFEESDVAVICKQDFALNDLDDKKIRIKQGMKIGLPFWLAKLLEQEGIVEIEQSEKFEFPVLYRMALAESEKRDLQKINKFFYILAQLTLKDIKEKKLKITYRQQQALELKLREFMTLRLNKIIKIAEKGKDITTMTRNMTPEEKWLFEYVVEAISKWREIVKAEKEEIEKEEEEPQI